MRQYFAFHLWPIGPWHLGEAGVDLVEAEERLHSDTLYSALCHAWSLRGKLHQCEEKDERGDFRYEFRDGATLFKVDEPPFLISSSFPFVRDREDEKTKPLCFWPQPLLELEDFFKCGLPPEDWQQNKIVKNCRYVSTTVWQRLADGQPFTAAECLAHRNGAKFWMTEDEAIIFDALVPKERIFYSGQKTLIPRVALDRLISKSNLYNVGRLFLAGNAGFYFLLGGDAQYADAVRLGLELLQDEGIGGERTYGYGRFAFEGPIPFADKFDHLEGNRYCLLSLCVPNTKTEDVHRLLSGKATYQILKRTGIIQSPQRRDIPRQTVRILGRVGLPFPKTRRLLTKGKSGLPMGWVRIRMD